MKIRTSFVTNSSSSSYVILYEVDIVDMEAIKAMIKEEFGNQGIRKFQDQIMSGAEYEIPEYANYGWNRDIPPSEIDPNKWYLEADSYSGDDCYDGDGRIVANMIPDDMKKRIAEWGD